MNNLLNDYNTNNRSSFEHGKHPHQGYTANNPVERIFQSVYNAGLTHRGWKNKKKTSKKISNFRPDFLISTLKLFIKKYYLLKNKPIHFI